MTCPVWERCLARCHKARKCIDRGQYCRIKPLILQIEHTAAPASAAPTL
ncbi:MAG: hypothetical protein LBH79_08165 [Nitrososphaerota archaeon]|nr:hypothetical protein [Nitrososphaerota archaeon]